MKKITPFLFAFFAVIQANALTFTATSNGNWNVGTTWGNGCSSGCVAGVNYPGVNDNAIIPSGKTVTIPNSSVAANVRDLTINAGGTLNMGWNIAIYKDLVNNGAMTGIGATLFNNDGWKISGTGTWPTGDWRVQGNRTILAGSVILKNSGFIVVYGGKTLTNNGTVTWGNDLKGVSATSKYINGVNSTTTCKAIVMAIGILDASAAGNTFIYGKAVAGAQSIKVPLTTYCNLTLSGVSSKALTGNTPITGNFFFAFGSGAFSNANFNFSVGGNWTNNANTNITNQATVTFTGTGTISRGSTEIFNNLTINASGTHTLARNIQVTGNVILTTGTFDVSASNFTITCKGNWTNNGGIFNGRAGLVNFSNVNHTIGGTTSTTFARLDLNHSGTVTLGNSNSTTLDFNYNNGLVNMATFDLTIGGNWNNTANTNLSNMGTVTFNGSVAQSIIRATTENFNNLTINSTNTVSPVEAIVSSGTMTVNSGTFDVTASNFAITTKDYTQTGGTYNAQAGTLTVTGNFSESAGTFNAQSGTVAIVGNFTHSAGTFTAGTGTVLFNGAIASTIGGASNTQFNILTLSNPAGVSLTAAKTLTNTMTLTVGNFNTGGFDFTLTSTAAGTARIAAVPVGSSLLGASYVMQRFIPGPAAAYWDFLGAPVNGSTLARWDNVVAPTPFYMSGVAGNDGNACCPIFHSVQKFVESTNTYSSTGITVATALTIGKGYEVWVASDMTQLAAPLSFDSKGSTGSTTTSIAVTRTGANGYNLIANPKLSQILWSSVFAASTSITNSYMILDETLQNYAIWNGATSTGTGQTAGSGGVINSTQGFMVRATANTTVKVTEASKTALTSSFVRTAEATNVIKMKLTGTRNAYGSAGMISFIENGNDLFDDGDMPFIASPNLQSPSLKIMSADGQELLSSNVNNNTESHEISLKASAPLPGMYTISFQGISNFNNYNCIYLQDLKTGKVFDLKRQDSYSFLITDPSTEYEFVLSLENEVNGSNGNFACRFEKVTPSDHSVNMFVNQQGFNLDFDYATSTPVTIEIYNALGELVAAPVSTEVTDNTLIVGSDLMTGLYIVKVSTSKETVNKKLIHQ